MKKISLRKLQVLASKLGVNGVVTRVYEDEDYIGVLYGDTFLSVSEFRLISRSLPGVHWFVESFVYDAEFLFISFNKSHYFEFKKNERL